MSNFKSKDLIVKLIENGFSIEGLVKATHAISMIQGDKEVMKVAEMVVMAWEVCEYDWSEFEMCIENWRDEFEEYMD